MPTAKIAAIDYYVPNEVVTNETLAELFPEWPPNKIFEKTGIRERRVAAADETATDLAVKAGMRLFSSTGWTPDDIDFVVFCTESADYLLPSSASLIQDRLGIPTSAGALDINQGCSGYVYGLSIAKGLIESGSCKHVLFLTGDTYSKYLAPDDKSSRTLFGDGAAATIIATSATHSATDPGSIGPFVFGSDGSGAGNLIVRNGGARNRSGEGGPVLSMNGSSIFSFSLRVVPAMVREVLDRADMSFDDIDYFVFHQANQFMIEALRRTLKIPQDKFVIDLEELGNTVSSTIPIAVKHLLDGETDRNRKLRLLLAGFGVGLSWASVIIEV